MPTKLLLSGHVGVPCHYLGKLEPGRVLQVCGQHSAQGPQELSLSLRSACQHVLSLPHLCLCWPCSLVSKYEPQSYQDILDTIRHNFDLHYRQNRAPFLMSFHARWFDLYPSGYAVSLALEGMAVQNDDTGPL